MAQKHFEIIRNALNSGIDPDLAVVTGADLISGYTMDYDGIMALPEHFVQMPDGDDFDGTGPWPEGISTKYGPNGAIPAQVVGGVTYIMGDNGMFAIGFRFVAP